MSLPDPGCWKTATTAIMCFCSYFAHGNLEITDSGPQNVFPGKRDIPVMFRNPVYNEYSRPLSIRLYQTSSSTGALLAETNWKRLQVLGGQTIVESAELSFPEITAETRFVVQWIANGRTVLGTTAVMVYPSKLLRRLAFLSGEHPVGLFDPQHQLRGPFHAAGVEFQLLGADQLETFPGRLVIGGMWTNASDSRNISVRTPEAKAIKKLASRGAAIVWINPPEDQPSRLKPSFYSVAVDKGCVVVAQSNMLARFADDPVAQLNLIRLAEYALKPEQPVFPCSPF